MLLARVVARGIVSSARSNQRRPCHRSLSTDSTTSLTTPPQQRSNTKYRLWTELFHDMCRAPSLADSVGIFRRYCNDQTPQKATLTNLIRGFLDSSKTQVGWRTLAAMEVWRTAVQLPFVLPNTVHQELLDHLSRDPSKEGFSLELHQYMAKKHIPVQWSTSSSVLLQSLCSTSPKQALLLFSSLSAPSSPHPFTPISDTSPTPTTTTSTASTLSTTPRHSSTLTDTTTSPSQSPPPQSPPPQSPHEQTPLTGTQTLLRLLQSLTSSDMLNEFRRTTLGLSMGWTKQVSPAVLSFVSRSFFRHGKIADALKFYSKYCFATSSTNQEMCEVLLSKVLRHISALQSTNREGEAQWFLSEALSLHTQHHSARHTQELIRRFFSAKQHSQVVLLFVTHHNHLATLVSHTTLEKVLFSATKTRDMECSRIVMETLLKKRSSDEERLTHANSLLYLSHSNSNDEVFRVMLEEMFPKYNLTPNSKTHLLILAHFAMGWKLRSKESLEVYLGLLHDANTQRNKTDLDQIAAEIRPSGEAAPLISFHNGLMHEYFKAGEHSTVLELFKAVESHSVISVNALTYPYAVDSLFVLDQHEVAMMMLESLAQSNLPDKDMAFSRIGNFLLRFQRDIKSSEKLLLLWQQTQTDATEPSPLLTSFAFGVCCANDDIHEAQSRWDEIVLDRVLSPHLLSDFTAALMRHRNYHSVMTVYDEIKRRNLEIPSDVQHRLISAFAWAGRLDKLREIVDYTSLTSSMDDHTLSTVINAHVIAGEYDRGLELFNASKARSVPNHVVYAVAIKLCGNARKKEELKQIYDDMSSNLKHVITVRELNVALHAFAQCKEIERAFGVCDDIMKLGHTPDAITLNILMDAAADHGSHERVRQLFELGRGLHNAHLYNTYLHVCSALNDPTTALAVFAQMKADAVVPDEFTYCTMLDVCAKAKEKYTDTAWIIWNEMLEQGVKPNVQVYTAMLICCANATQLQNVEQLFDMMMDSKVQLSRDVFYGCLKLAKRLRAPTFARHILAKMEGCGYALDLLSLTLLMSVYCKVREIETVFEIFNQIRTLGFEPNVFTMNILIEACRVTRDPAKALYVFHMIENMGLKPDSLSHDALIGVFCMARNLPLMETWFNAANAKNIPLDSNTYNRVIETYGRCTEVEKALDVYDMMKKRGLSISTATWNTLIGAYAHSGRFDEAMGMYKKMWIQGMTPDARTFSALVSACRKTHQHSRIIEVYTEMQTRDVQPNEGLYFNVVEGLLEAGDSETAVTLAQEMSSQLKITDMTPLSIRSHFEKLQETVQKIPQSMNADEQNDNDDDDEQNSNEPEHSDVLGADENETFKT